MSKSGLFAGKSTQDAPTNGALTTKQRGYHWFEWGSSPMIIYLTINDALFQLPLRQFLEDGITPLNYDFTVDWGDGSSDHITAWDDAASEHDYTGLDDTFIVTITGTMEGWSFYEEPYSNNANMNIAQWGNVGFRELSDAFYECPNLSISATDAPNLSQITSLLSFFESTNFVTADFTAWDVSGIEDFDRMFYDTKFNNDTINSWDVGSGIYFETMFFNSDFNQDLSAWTPTKSTTFENMFMMTSMSVANYDLLLNAWSLLTFDNSGLLFWFDQNYTIATSQAARDILTNAPNSWTITDLGGI